MRLEAESLRFCGTRAEMSAALGISLRASRENPVALFDSGNREVGRARERGVERTETGPRRYIKQILQRGDDEITLLEVNVAERSAHHAFKIEPNAVWRGRR